MSTARARGADSSAALAIRAIGGAALALLVTVLWTWPLGAGLGLELPLDPFLREPAQAPIHLHLFELGETARSLAEGHLPMRWEGAHWPVGQSREAAHSGFLPQVLASPFVALFGASAGAVAFGLVWLAAGFGLAFRLGRRLGFGRASASFLGVGCAFSPFVLVEFTRGWAHVPGPLLPLALTFAFGIRQGPRIGLAALGLAVTLLASYACSLGTGWSLSLGAVAVLLLEPTASAHRRASSARAVAWTLVLLATAVPLMLLVPGEAERIGRGVDPGASRAEATAAADADEAFAWDWAELARTSVLHPARTAPAAASGSSIPERSRRPGIAPQLSWTALLVALCFGVRRAFGRRMLGAAFVLYLLAWFGVPGVRWLAESRLDAIAVAHAFLFLSAASGLERMRGASGTLAFGFGLALPLLALEWLAVPLRTFEARPPAFVRELGEVPGEGSWILFPLTALPHPAFGWQAVHGVPTWLPVPDRSSFSSWLEAGRRSPGLLDFGRRIAVPGDDSGSGADAREQALELEIELTLADVDHVLLDLDRVRDVERALDVLDSLPGFERSPHEGAVLWWYRLPPLYRRRTP